MYEQFYFKQNLNCCFLSLFYYLSIISAFHQSIHQVENLFISLTVFCWNLAILIIYLDFLHYCWFNNSLRESYLLLTNNSLTPLSDSVCLISVKFVKILEQNFESCVMFSDKEHYSANQSRKLNYSNWCWVTSTLLM